MKKQGTRKNRNTKLIFCWMIHTLTKGWHLCCYKYRRRNLNVIHIFILVKVAFFLERIQRSSSIAKKSNKQMKKTGILMKLRKNSVIIAKSLWTRYYMKQFLCERLHRHNPPPPPPLLFAYIRILIIIRNNRMPPIRSSPRTEPCEISCSLIFLPTKNSYRLKQE